MPFPKDAQKRGGKAPCPNRVKVISRQRIGENRPWLKSTGPRSSRGKGIARLNAVKTTELTFYALIKSWESADFWHECAEAERVINRLKSLKERLDISAGGVNLSLDFEFKQEIKGDSEGNRWAYYFARLTRIRFNSSWSSGAGIPVERYETLSSLALERYDQAIEQVKEIIA